MQEPNGEKRLLPPYLAYKTFRNFIEQLRVTMPARIDRSVMPSLSGANQSWLIGALKYFKLIDEDGVPDEALKKLAKAEDQERKRLLREMLQRFYPFIFNSIKLDGATPRQLEEQFSKTAATGDTVKKCIAFFLAAAKETDLELSPYLRKMRYSKSSGQRSRRSQLTSSIAGENRSPEVEDNLEERGPVWVNALMAKFPTFDPAWPDEVKAKWFDAFKQVMDMMKKQGEGQE